MHESTSAGHGGLVILDRVVGVRHSALAVDVLDQLDHKGGPGRRRKDIQLGHDLGDAGDAGKLVRLEVSRLLAG